MQARMDWDNSPQVVRTHIRRVFGELAALTKNQPVRLEHQDDELIGWLSQLGLLVNLPFHYLIPTESMLPSDSIRLFYVNPNWLQALIDGACSLGRNASLDLTHDQELIDAVISQIGKRMKAVRPLLQNKSVTAKELDDEVQAIGGFLLRSPLVPGWRGLEFRALSSQGTPLRALRIETLSDDVLIGLFEGVPYTLEMAQPPEGFFFGFNQINGRYMKRMRNLDSGELLPESDSIEVAVQNENLRTIDIYQTAKHMEAYFQKEITSAEFALQMIKTPYIGRVIRTDE
ncbi:hypothetical protein [Paenibacillus sp. JJ-223]|uniref:hypothetical protein n=1 Tax=Paenibacillus sp. JJ-223 TaxID=2905647 RepID=UPI001F207949|nr:hypothetical protein [Paenibacillus sp. JJ-223]CAH1199328.1 hypothetical protein PAECIP111890_01566 [Paenibacillus sp. JJ-223]